MRSVRAVVAMITVLAGSGTQARAWQRVVGTPAVADGAWAVAMDPAGDVVAAGLAAGDFAVVKLAAADGRILWQARVDGAAHAFDRGIAVTVDAAGDVVAVGYPLN